MGRRTILIGLSVVLLFVILLATVPPSVWLMVVMVCLSALKCSFPAKMKVGAPKSGLWQAEDVKSSIRIGCASDGVDGTNWNHVE